MERQNRSIMQSAINVSSADAKTISTMVAAVSNVAQVVVADTSSDIDHNRTVITLFGIGSSLKEAVLRIFAVALDLVDLSRHHGEHPRMGAIDVIPFTPWEGTQMDECRRIAWETGEAVANRYSIPVYYYGEAALREDRKDLSNVRRGEYELLKDEIGTVSERRPDYGPPCIHPTLGATAIGARGPLIAFNVNLHSENIDIAKAIASRVRGGGGGLSAVKAMGVHLQQHGMVQVSMNLLDFRKSAMHQALEMVKSEARRYGVSVAGCEIIGLVPLEALVDSLSFYLGIPELSRGKVVEYQLDRYKRQL